MSLGLINCLINEEEMALILAERLKDEHHTEFSIADLDSGLRELVADKSSLSINSDSVFPVIHKLFKLQLIRQVPGITFSSTANNSKQFELIQPSD